MSSERHQRLLVVDDDSRLRDLLTRYLTEQGFEVKAVGDSTQMDRARSRVNWTAGSAADFLWSNGTNWDLGVPIAVDDVIFGTPVPNPGALLNPNGITLGAGSIGNALMFQDSYTLTGGDLTLSSGSIRVDLAQTATIGSLIAGTAGLTLSGGGALRLTNLANSYTGATLINSGSLIITDQAQLGTDASVISITAGNATPSNTNLIGFSGGSLVLDGTAAGFTLARNIDFEGRGPIGDRGASILSLGNNTLSGILSSAVSAQTPATVRSSRINNVNGTLTLSGTLNVGGTSATTFVALGGVNSAGVGVFSLSGIVRGQGASRSPARARFFSIHPAPRGLPDAPPSGPVHWAAFTKR